MDDSFTVVDAWIIVNDPPSSTRGKKPFIEELS